MRAIKLCAVVAVVALVAIGCQSAETADAPAGNAAANAASNEAGEAPATDAQTAAADQRESTEPAAPRAEGDRLAELLASDDYLLLDVRRPDELEEYGTVEGYLNIPVEELADRLEEVPRDRPILTAWNGGGRAARAAALLEENGFEVVAFCGLGAYEGEKIFPKAGGGQQ